MLRSGAGARTAAAARAEGRSELGLWGVPHAVRAAGPGDPAHVAARQVFSWAPGARCALGRDTAREVPYPHLMVEVTAAER